MTLRNELLKLQAGVLKECALGKDVRRKPDPDWGAQEVATSQHGRTADVQVQTATERNGASIRGG